MNDKLSDISVKARENRASRAAARQGKLLVKSRRRDPNATGYGTYVLVADQPDGRDIATAMLASGDGVSLDAIEAFLNWTDIFVVEPGTDTAEIDFIAEASNRVIVTHIDEHEIGWLAEVLNDGNPLDHSLAGDRGDKDFAVEQAQQWARDYFKFIEAAARQEVR